MSTKFLINLYLIYLLMTVEQEICCFSAMQQDEQSRKLCRECVQEFFANYKHVEIFSGVFVDGSVGRL